jgi:hypothetical protein
VDDLLIVCVPDEVTGPDRLIALATPAVVFGSEAKRPRRLVA